MQNQKDFLVKTINSKKIVWFKCSNKYIQMEKPAFMVFNKLQEGESISSITNWASEMYGIPISAAHRFAKEIQHAINTNRKPADSETPETIETFSENKPESIYSKKYYHFGSTDFCFHYSNAQLERMIHPLLTYQEVKNPVEVRHLFQLVQQKDTFFIKIDGKIIGHWNCRDEHLIKGKVFMELLNKGYKKDDKDWMVVMHASALCDGQNSILFQGKSGSGKSTLAAILMAGGYQLVADDFVPIEVLSGEAFHLPVALSIKKKALSHLSSLFPEFLKAKESNYPDHNKTDCYLSPHSPTEIVRPSFPVRAIVFVRFNNDVEFQMNEISPSKAFQIIVTESWLSPIYENVEHFLDWFASMPFYELVYSNNNKMVAAVKKLFLLSSTQHPKFISE